MAGLGKVMKPAFLPVLLLLGVWASSACATDVLPPPSLDKPRKKDRKPSVTRMGLAISLTFDTTTWAAVGVSTAAPAVELASFMRRGYYRLEILQLTLMARETERTLKDLMEMRTKGSGLREIAEELSLEYEPLYQRALEKARDAEKRMKAVEAVLVSPPEGKK